MIPFHAYNLRPYCGEDLHNVLRFVGECNRLANFCGYLHPGDVCHLMSNALRGRDLEKHFYLCEDANQQILALVVLYPARFHGYDVLIHPHTRTRELESALLIWAEQALWSLLQEIGSGAIWINSDGMDCDIVRCQILREHGYTSAEAHSFCYAMRSLHEPIAEPVLPEGFTIRAVIGEQEADAVGHLHSSAFSSHWPTGEYLKVMRTPGFSLDHELVVVAPDGHLAAFLVYWIDPVSKSGLFEPVGCHQDFRRSGLTRALMYEGMRHMLMQGMTTAIVTHEPAEKNPAAAALYRSVGFKVKLTITDFRKQMR